MVTYDVVAKSNHDVKSFEWTFHTRYAHSTHLAEIMRNLDDMYLDLVSITVRGA